jgi:Meckel syndrome type 1 protein
MNTPHIPDDDFERDRATVGAAYARVYENSREPHSGPPPAIDAAIRAAARRAVNAGPRTVERPWINRWTKPLSAAAVVVLTASVIFVAIEQDSSLKVAAVKAPLETKILEMRADRPAESPIVLARPAATEVQADIVVPKEETPPPSELRARQTGTLSSRDQIAPALSAERKKRDDAPPPPPQVVVAEATAPKQFKSEAPVLANAAPVVPPVYAPAAPPAAAPVVPAPATAPVQAAGNAAPPPAAAGLQSMAKEKAADRAANARAEADTGRAATVEAKTEKIAVTGSKIEPDQQAPKAVAATPAAPPAPAAKAVIPIQPAPAQRIAPQTLSPKEPTPSQAFDRLRELRAQLQWKEFDELLANLEKRWPNIELPTDLAATKREREKAKAGENR